MQRQTIQALICLIRQETAHQGLEPPKARFALREQLVLCHLLNRFTASLWSFRQEREFINKHTAFNELRSAYRTCLATRQNSETMTKSKSKSKSKSKYVYCQSKLRMWKANIFLIELLLLFSPISRNGRLARDHISHKLKMDDRIPDVPPYLICQTGLDRITLSSSKSSNMPYSIQSITAPLVLVLLPPIQMRTLSLYNWLKF